jgi:hypothetical protein
MKPVYDQTDLEYADYLEMLAGDLEEMGQDGTSADIYEACAACGAFAILLRKGASDGQHPVSKNWQSY